MNNSTPSLIRIDAAADCDFLRLTAIACNRLRLPAIAYLDTIACAPAGCE